MKQMCILMWIVLSVVTGVFAQNSDKITIAAAADLKFAMDEIVTEFKKVNPESNVEVVYGSSGKANTQILQGAPFDMFFCADIKYPLDLQKKGLCASEVKTYAWGRIVLWSATIDSSKLSMSILTDSSISRIAIANPMHAPYGERAREALMSLGLWDKVEKKLVYGENIAQAAQFIASGNAQAGILALSIAMNPELLKKGHYLIVPDTLHAPLEQGYVITKRAADNKLAGKFADFMEEKLSRTIMKKYGFVLPGEK
jgi:molybdate transport system substrate-binding protein